MENRLKTLRNARRLTQDEAAEAMGVSKGQYIKLERGERRLTADYISRAAKAFQVPQSEILEAAPKTSLDRLMAEFAAQYADEAETLREELERRIMRERELLSKGSRQNSPSR